MRAVTAMKEGKKVRRKHWKSYNGFCLYNSEDIGLMFSNKRHISDKLTIEDIESTDWEIVKERKTLSDKRESWVSSDNRHTGFQYNEKDIKAALKEFMEFLDDSDQYWAFKLGVKDIFGERLLDDNRVRD